MRALLLLAVLLHLPGAASFQPSTTDELVAAKNAWLDDASAATAMYGHISTWDTSLITDMDTIFCANEGWANMPGDGWLTRCDTRAATFDEDISGWDMSSVTTMSYMFYQAAAFNQDLSGWDISSVEYMHSTFLDASSFNQDLGWDLSALATNGGLDGKTFQGTISGDDSACYGNCPTPAPTVTASPSTPPTALPTPTPTIPMPAGGSVSGAGTVKPALVTVLCTAAAWALGGW